MPTHPHFRRNRILHVSLDCEHTCQISSESVHGFRSPREPKMTLLHFDLAHRPYNTVRINVLHCDTLHTVCCSSQPGQQHEPDSVFRHIVLTLYLMYSASSRVS